MLLIECNHVRKYFGDRLIIEIDHLKVYSEDKIGIVGVNGVGKTTLINILSQRLEPDEGWVKLNGRYSYISQHEAPENKRISPEIASKFGIPTTWDANMSGGEKTRFKLAEGLSQKSLLIFADEPTSNIDMEGIELLENQFLEFQGGLVLISHDRSFLDKLCNKIIEVENGKIKVYPGNYSNYSEQKRAERERTEFEYLQYVNEKKRLEKVVVETSKKMKSIRKTPKRMGNSEARLHKMGNQKAKANLDKAQKRTETRIEQLEVKERHTEEEKIKLDIVATQKLYSKVIIEGKKINKVHGEKVIFKDAEFKIENGSKVALIGSNGSGKSTLLKMITARDNSIKIAPGAKIGYFSQDMSILDENSSILQNVMKESIYQEGFARTLLARLLFKGDQVYKRVGLLSGGERVKVSFAKILLQDINLLILDEPTNYLDINSLEVVEKALREYDRTLLFVSHDRKFVSSVADHIMTIEKCGIKVINGNFEEYKKGLDKNMDNNNEKEEIKKQIILLENRLSEVIGKISIPSRKDDLEALDKDYQSILGELKRLRKIYLA